MLSFLVKGWSAIIVFLMVPLTLKILGQYANGVWLTISSVLMWFDMLDIGLGNGLRNAVAQYVAENNASKVREVVSSTLFMLAVIMLPVALLLIVLIQCFDVYEMLNVDILQIDNLRSILTTSVIVICSTLVFKVIGNFYMGLQMPAINNALIVMGQTLALFATYIAYILGSNSLYLVVIINICCPLLIWLVSYPYTFSIKYKGYCPDINSVRISTALSLCNTGVKFFVLQICSVVLFTSANVIICQIFSPSDVTVYQIAYRYFSIMLVLFTVICMPFWNATTDAYVRKDFQWIKNASRKLNFMLCGICLGMILMVLASEWVYEVWVGSEIYVPQSLSISMACYLIILIISMRYSYFLNGIGVLRIQLFFTIAATVAFIPLSFFACQLFHSVTSLVVVMCLVNIPGLVANIYKFNKIVNIE